MLLCHHDVVEITLEPDNPPCRLCLSRFLKHSWVTANGKYDGEMFFVETGVMLPVTVSVSL